MLTTLLVGIILAWIYINTKGSIFAAMLGHAMFNWSNHVFPALDVNAAGLILFGLYFAVVVYIIWQYGSRTLTKAWAIRFLPQLKRSESRIARDDSRAILVLQKNLELLQFRCCGISLRSPPASWRSQRSRSTVRPARAPARDGDIGTMSLTGHPKDDVRWGDTADLLQPYQGRTCPQRVIASIVSIVSKNRVKNCPLCLLFPLFPPHLHTNCTRNRKGDSKKLRFLFGEGKGSGPGPITFLLIIVKLWLERIACMRIYSNFVDWSKNFYVIKC